MEPHNTKGLGWSILICDAAASWSLNDQEPVTTVAPWMRPWLFKAVQARCARACACVHVQYNPNLLITLWHRCYSRLVHLRLCGSQMLQGLGHIGICSYWLVLDWITKLNQTGWGAGTFQHRGCPTQVLLESRWDKAATGRNCFVFTV